MKFSTVADAFEQIEQISARLEITQLLAALLKNATAHEAAIISNISLGQLHPPYVGTQFNIAEKSCIPVIAELLEVSETTVKRHAQDSGDLGTVVARGQWRAKDTLTVTQVYQRLCELEEVSGTGSQEGKARLLKKLLSDLDPLSAKHVVRIILGKLRLGFSDMTIIDALSWMEVGNKSLRDELEDAYNTCADIGIITSTLKERGIQAIKKMHIRVGIPIRPALAERLPTAKAVIEKIGACVAQPKLDGFRLQIHIDKTKKKHSIHFFSRNLQDMSAMFPDLAQALLKLPVKDIICEGEAIGYDPNTGIFLPFQETVKRKRKHGIAQAQEEFPLKVFLFDLLYLNDKDLLNVSHEERRTQLIRVFKGFDNDDIQVVDEYSVKNTKELEDYFMEIIDAGLEGLVIKRPNALYKPGKRNFNWIKLKRQAAGHLEDTIDCVILGYYTGAGKRAEFGIGAFLVGVYNDQKDIFQTVAKIGTGLKDEQWKELKKKCDELKINHKPHNVECAKTLIPDVFVVPSIVCVIRADEITLSPVHAAGKTEDKLGYALRFPRFMGYRPDKKPDQATTVKELKRLYEDQFKRGKN